MSVSAWLFSGSVRNQPFRWCYGVVVFLLGHCRSHWHAGRCTDMGWCTPDRRPTCERWWLVVSFWDASTLDCLRVNSRSSESLRSTLHNWKELQVGNSLLASVVLLGRPMIVAYWRATIVFKLDHHLVLVSKSHVIGGSWMSDLRRQIIGRVFAWRHVVLRLSRCCMVRLRVNCRHCRTCLWLSLVRGHRPLVMFVPIWSRATNVWLLHRSWTRLSILSVVVRFRLGWVIYVSASIRRVNQPTVIACLSIWLLVVLVTRLLTLLLMLGCVAYHMVSCALLHFFLFVQEVVKLLQVRSSHLRVDHVSLMIGNLFFMSPTTFCCRTICLLSALFRRLRRLFLWRFGACCLFVGAHLSFVLLVLFNLLVLSLMLVIDVVFNRVIFITEELGSNWNLSTIHVHILLVTQVVSLIFGKWRVRWTSTVDTLRAIALLFVHTYRCNGWLIWWALCSIIGLHILHRVVLSLDSSHLLLQHTILLLFLGCSASLAL